MHEVSNSFYSDKLLKHGNSAQGVGWKNEDAQKIRFDQLAKIIEGDTKFTINDLGCGTGGFVEYLQKQPIPFTYHGYDISTEMIERANQNIDKKDLYHFSVIPNAEAMAVADYTIASGIFNLRFGQTAEEWLQYMLKTITTMNEKSMLGFAFNALTKYSDTELMKEELYYTDPLFMFDYCKTNFSKNVALLHDYRQYDFTILVRKN